MAYVKRTWNCGDKITADALNHIEQGIEDAVCDCGYECEETRTLLTNETVTTALDEGYYVADLSYVFQDNPPHTLLITFDGVEYECEEASRDSYFFYGGYSTHGPDFSEYPFLINISGSGTTLYTETAGTHTVKIETLEITVTETSGCFVAAVRAAISPLILQYEYDTTDPNTKRITTPFNEIRDAYIAGRAVILDPAETKTYYSMIGMRVQGANSTVTFADESEWTAYRQSSFPEITSNT